MSIWFHFSLPDCCGFNKLLEYSNINNNYKYNYILTKEYLFFFIRISYNVYSLGSICQSEPYFPR